MRVVHISLSHLQLEQMDLEVREIPPQSRGMYSNRMRSYKQEMGKLETDFVSSLLPSGSSVWIFTSFLCCFLPMPWSAVDAVSGLLHKINKRFV